MDIENMHPFCLPFGLCHDATSSSVAADFVPLLGNNDSSTTNTNGNNNNDSNNNNNNNNDIDNNNSKIRSKTSSPTDELFRHFNNATSITSQSLLSDDLIIGSSSSLDIIGDDSTFYSLELDINIEADTSHTDIAFDDEVENEDDDGDLIKGVSQEDWYCNQYSTLFSPTPTSHQRGRRKSLIRSAALNQVFQHVVDPVDIKSSPTLAQLNLNSNDDPTDGIWETASRTTSASASSPTISTNTDLLASNSTSIINNGPLGCSSNQNVTCNHLHRHHHHAHHTHHLAAHYTHHLNNVPSSPACHHLHLHHLHQQQSRLNTPSISSTQTTCLAVTPFRRPEPQQQQYSPCCHNLLSTSTALNLQAHNSSTNNGANLKPSATLNQLNQLAHSNGSSPPVPRAEKQKLNHQEQQQQQRSASPALVTSSSSPLSSSSQQQQQQQLINVATGETRLIDNKLKENIEYLTALLCDGNKLENNNQQPTISSTMARSYSTLAHSLSTGPKLLDRPQQGQQQQSLAQQPEATPNAVQANNFCDPAYEASSSFEGVHHQGQLSMQNVTGLKRPYQSDQWFKAAVESSVSAADSTESQVSSGIAGSNNDRALLHCSPNVVAAATNLNHQQVASHSLPQLHHTTMQKSNPDMKVLSSLLNATSCNGSTNLMATTNQAHTCNSGWPVNHLTAAIPTSNGPQQSTIEPSQVPSVASIQPSNATAEQSSNTNKQDSYSTSIPPNGKPITLTPIANQTSLILQQQQQLGQKSRGNLFAQPASPSASSTASSGGNADIGSTSTSASSAKRQRGNGTNSGGVNNQLQSGVQKQTSSNRSVRPNSMSTDCSLSSHDEGFSSTVDNDDCGASTRGGDSDDDDDVDSDDESFYGDYTNSDLIGASISDNAENKWTLNMGRTRRNGQKRYFWQYNVQSKGPKGTRICSTDDSEDPFVLPEASDPVFSNDCQVEGVKHSGKARRGDGNDLTPNPRKLLMIGLELKKLGKIINDLAPVTDLPVNARNKTRKEKNKLASRACRLKKKAQHEANKIKLYGLQREHQQVVLAIYDIRKLLNETLAKREPQSKVEGSQSGQQLKEQQRLNGGQESTTNDNGTVNSSVKMIAEQCSMQVAGQTSDYVNSVLEKVVSGCIDGGLQT